MTDMERVARYRPMRDADASPAEVYAKARQEGVGLAAALYVIRALYGLNLEECRAVARSIEGALPGEVDPIRSREQLRNVLVDELAYCPCAGEEALELLRDVLQSAQDRYGAVKGPPEEFSAISRRLEAQLCIDEFQALASWFVHGLDKAGLIQHGFHITDLWITAKGSWLLDGLHRFPGPLRNDAGDSLDENIGGAETGSGD